MPHALIVDDSKTARYALRLLLDRQHITADMVESAEHALDYLERESPDLIFMDHMMPGMDGFQAVKAIKSNAATAQIPIVMYTSVQGGVYFGQARALGAADVISKPASAEDLAAVLQRLQENQQLGANKTQAPAVDKPRASSSRTFSPPEYVPTETAPPPAAEPSAPTPAALAKPIPEPATATSWPYWLAGIGLAAALVLGVILLNMLSQRDQLDKQRLLAFKAVEWAINQAQEFPYGEPPFGADRLPQLQELVQQLESTGFRGTIRLESHIGEFCLIHLPADDGSGTAWSVAPPELHLTDCNALGQSTQQSLTLSAASSAAFKRFLAELPAGIRIDIVPLGSSEPKSNYPTDPNVSAGDWNRVAQHNQRIHIILQPSPVL
jgi:CheY-like chemotaxis protein